MRQHYPLNANGAEDAGRLPWTDGVPQTGTEGSYPGHALFTDAEAEILAAIDASGQTRNGNDLTQLVQAFARGIYLGQFSGTANALAAALPNSVVFASLLRGTRLTGFVTATNTAGVTVAVSGIGPVTAPATVQASLLSRGGNALQAGDLPVNQDFEIRWDGNAFRMMGSVVSDAGSGSSNTQIVNYVTTNRVPSNARRVTNNARISLSGTGGNFYTAISSFLDASGNPYTKLGPGTGSGATVLKATGFIGSYTPAVGGAGATYARLTDGTRTDTQPLCGNVNLSGVGPVGIPGFVEFWLVGVSAGVVNLQALAGRLDASNWATIINADGVDYGGTGSHTGTGSLSYLDIEELIP